MQQHSLLSTAADDATTTFLPRRLSGRNSKRNKLGTMVNQQSTRNVYEQAKKSDVEIPQLLPTEHVFSSSEISAMVRSMQNCLFGKTINSESLLQGQKKG